LGRWLDISHCVASDSCYWIVTDLGQVVSMTSVEDVTCKDYLNEDTKAKVKEFKRKLGEHLDDSNFILQGEDGDDLKMLEDLDDEGIGATMEDGICMHRLMMKVICFNCWMKSWIIRRMIQQLI
jgi:hypothetical protein